MAKQTTGNEAQGANVAKREQTPEQIIASIEKMDASNFEELTSSYIELKEDSTYGFIFNGITTFTSREGETKEAVKLTTKDGLSCINGAAVLLSACKRIQAPFAFIKVVTRKKIKTANGYYMDLSVFQVLPENTVNQD